MLSVNLRPLEAHEIHLQGELTAAELDFGMKDEMIRADLPLQFDLKAEKIHDAVLVTGSLKLILDCQCVRCLKSFQHKLKLPHWTCYLALSGEDKVAVDNDCVDLTPFVREDMLLEFPQHPLCKPDCAGLMKKSRGAAPNFGGKEVKPSVWAELDKLKL